MGISNLYEKKLMFLNQIYDITNNIKFTQDIESNINKYNSLYKKRAKIFEEIYVIDKEIKAMYPSSPIFDEKSKEVAKKITDLDKELQKHHKVFRGFLEEKVKGYKLGRKTREKFNPYAKDDYSTFESKA
ncbi:MAG: hypothetical protein ACK5LV_02555 [Lachnospirales bacterium]